MLQPAVRVASLALLCAAVLVAAPARAELVIADSLEVVVARSELVARATVVRSAARGEGAGREWREVTVTLGEVFKGPRQPRQVTFSAPWTSDVAPTGELLILLVRGTARPEVPAALRDAWVTTPQGFTFDAPYLSLAQERTLRVVSRTFELLETRAAVLAAVQTAARAAPTVVSDAVAVEAPWESPVAQALYSGSAVLVQIPVDEEALRWAGREVTLPDVGRRLEAAKVFAARKTDANIARLQRLLDDPGYWPQRTQGVSNGFNLYPVRRWAFDTLKRWGVAVKAPVIEEPFVDPPPAAPPKGLRPAKALNSAPWFVDTAAETEILQPQAHERATACLAQSTGGVPNGWRGVALRGVYRVPGFARPVAILQAVCTLGNAGFETHTWVLDTGTMAAFDLGGTTAFDDVLASTRGLVAVRYLDKVQGAPGRCRYEWLGRSGRSEGGPRLVARHGWDDAATGEGPTATCDPFGERKAAR